MAAVEDVTQNLPSLQFEAALSDNEKYLLRKLTPLVIAQFVVVFNTETLVVFLTGNYCICEVGVTRWRFLPVLRRALLVMFLCFCGLVFILLFVNVPLVFA